MADYFESGFCVREASWHGKETLLADYPDSWDDARLAAGLMWEPTITTVYRKVVDENGNESYVECESTKVVQRDDTGVELGGVSGTFELITHAEMGQIVETVLEQPNVKIETMGSVRGGRQVYCVIRLDEPYEISGDRDGFGDQVSTLPYFVVLNSHDGTGACKGLYSQVRVVCWNTVQAADADGDRHGAQFSLRHTSGVKERIEEAREILAGARVEALRWKAIAEQLAQQPVTDEQQLQFLNEWIPEPPAGVTSPRVKANIERDRTRFLHVLRDSATNCEMQHNALGVFNAAVEYADHLRGFQNRDTYMGRQILRAEPLKTRALTIVRDLVGVAN
jgi:phage/plasmid-like protein (TIGR03299 family)